MSSDPHADALERWTDADTRRCRRVLRAAREEGGMSREPTVAELVDDLYRRGNVPERAASWASAALAAESMRQRILALLPLVGAEEEEEFRRQVMALPLVEG